MGGVAADVGGRVAGIGRITEPDALTLWLADCDGRVTEPDAWTSNATMSWGINITVARMIMF